MKQANKKIKSDSHFCAVCAVMYLSMCVCQDVCVCLCVVVLETQKADHYLITVNACVCVSK